MQDKTRHAKKDKQMKKETRQEIQEAGTALTIILSTLGGLLAVFEKKPAYVVIFIMILIWQTAEILTMVQTPEEEG